MGSFLRRSRPRRSCGAPRRTHPRLKIFGLLEARLMDADVMLLGGLDETVWPPQAQSDAFLNRPMRAALGLTPPERKIGQTAHDFVAGMGMSAVILSRAAKRDGTPMVASRFVQRLAAVGGQCLRSLPRARAGLPRSRARHRSAEEQRRSQANGRCQARRSICARSASA